MKKRGKVYIIGAGPGDPGLITLRAVECLRKSDVVVYDYLVGSEIFGFVREDARLIYVGKKGGDHTVSQNRLNEILVEEAVEGNLVARLKGGDPFIFGRGGEEAEVLKKAGIPFEVIPGITSAIAVPAYAGIPLTHRSFTSTVAFVTGHEDPTKEESGIDWDSIAAVGTVVFLMGVKNLPQIVAGLRAHGKEPDTPAALIRWGTTPDQDTLAGTLETIVAEAEKRKFAPPAIFIVGGVVGLRDDLNWFETKPLFGKGVVITRPEEQSREFAALLRDAGARPVFFPTIKIVPPECYDALDGAIENIDTYNWIIFTSANGVKYFFERLRQQARDIRDLKGVKLCTIGPATAAAVERMGIKVDLVPDRFISEGVVTAFEGMSLSGQRVLIPRAEVARDIIPAGLTRLGACVDVVTAYKTVSSGRDRAELLDLIARGKVDVLTFTSPSTVTNFITIMGAEWTTPEDLKIACIGPVTEAAANTAGMRTDIVQGPYVIAGLVEAIINEFKNDK